MLVVTGLGLGRLLLQCLVVLWYDVLVGTYDVFDVFAMSPS